MESIIKADPVVPQYAHVSQPRLTRHSSTCSTVPSSNGWKVDKDWTIFSGGESPPPSTTLQPRRTSNHEAQIFESTNHLPSKPIPTLTQQPTNPTSSPPHTSIIIPPSPPLPSSRKGKTPIKDAPSPTLSEISHVSATPPSQLQPRSTKPNTFGIFFDSDSSDDAVGTSTPTRPPPPSGNVDVDLTQDTPQTQPTKISLRKRLSRISIDDSPSPHTVTTTKPPEIETSDSSASSTSLPLKRKRAKDGSNASGSGSSISDGRSGKRSRSLQRGGGAGGGEVIDLTESPIPVSTSAAQLDRAIAGRLAARGGTRPRSGRVVDTSSSSSTTRPRRGTSTTVPSLVGSSLSSAGSYSDSLVAELGGVGWNGDVGCGSSSRPRRGARRDGVRGVGGAGVGFGGGGGGGGGGGSSSGSSSSYMPPQTLTGSPLRTTRSGTTNAGSSSRNVPPVPDPTISSDEALARMLQEEEYSAVQGNSYANTFETLTQILRDSGGPSRGRGRGGDDVFGDLYDGPDVRTRTGRGGGRGRRRGGGGGVVFPGGAGEFGAAGGGWGGVVRDILGPSLASNPANYLPDGALDLSYESLLALSDQIGDVKPKGLPPHIISLLPTLTYREGMWDMKEEDERKCVICMEQYKGGEVLKGVVCGHWFHDGCIEAWLKTNRACP
ncbi:hypothetical protein HDV00_008505, partial [Rhizophlyctis rosea]